MVEDLLCPLPVIGPTSPAPSSPHELLMALLTCSSDSQITCGCSFLPHLSPLLKDPILMPPAPCSPPSLAVEGRVSPGGSAPCPKPTPHLQTPCLCLRLTLLQSELWEAWGWGSVSPTRAYSLSSPRVAMQNNSFAASEMSFLYSCKLLSDLYTHVAGRSAHCPVGEGRRSQRCFFSQQMQIIPFL